MSTASDDLYVREVEYATAVAAAAFAISALESATRDEEPQHLGGHGPSLGKIKSQKEPIVQTAKPDSESDEEKTKEGPSKADTSKPASEDGSEISEKIIHPVPPRRKRLTFSLSTKDSEEFETMKPKLDTREPSFPPPPPPPPPLRSRRSRPRFTLSSSKDFEEIERTMPTIYAEEPSFLMPPPPPIPPPFSRPLEAQKPRFPESEADAWERAELGKIKKRYEDLNLTILEWEDKRKKKAKRKLEKTESDPSRKRAKALEVYQADIERITQIAEGAKAQAKEKRRKEELKVKDKAEKYRETGEPPATCLCF